MKGLDADVIEIAIGYRQDTCWAIYVAKIARSLWVVHELQVKSRTGIKTATAYRLNPRPAGIT